MRATKWSDVRMGLTIEELELRDRKVVRHTKDGLRVISPLSGLLVQGRHCDRAVECGLSLDLEISSSGFDDPGNISGPPERCYPPDREDERRVVGATLWVHDQDGRPLAGVKIGELDSRLPELTEEFYDEIMGIELPEGPDGDDWDE